jgi:hypothetical protein
VRTTRLYFNLTKRWQSLLDDKGLEVADIDGALPGIIRAIKEVREEKRAELDFAGWKLDLVDQSGRLRASVVLMD